MDIRRNILGKIRHNDHQINRIQDRLKEKIHPDEYDSLLEKLDIRRGKSMAWNELLNELNNV